MLSHANRLRLEGEAIRDCPLAISGQLNPEMGGPGVFPPIPKEIIAGAKGGWPQNDRARDYSRRSIYIFARRNLRLPFPKVFDAPDNNLSCPARERSTTAPQSLTLLNADEVIAAAKLTAVRLMKEADSNDGRIAFRMQSHAPEVVDISRETDATRKFYDLDSKVTAEFGLRCLFARRIVEHGGRFVQLCCGDTNGWDGHSKRAENHTTLCAQSDPPVAGLLKDIKSRGLLDSTLVVWAGEFGRMPMSEDSNGSDRNPHGFSKWMAGGGVKGGQFIGATDAVGLRAVEERAHAHDIHAMILHLLAFDHTRLTYRHNGRAERLTDVAGNVIVKALA